MNKLRISHYYEQKINKIYQIGIFNSKLIRSWSGWKTILIIVHIIKWINRELIRRMNLFPRSYSLKDNYLRALSAAIMYAFPLGLFDKNVQLKINLSKLPLFIINKADNYIKYINSNLSKYCCNMNKIPKIYQES